MYARLVDSVGYLPNYGRAFSHRPDLFAAWVRLNTTVKAAMDPRRYELATVAAAVERRSSYCALAHGEKLLGLGSTAEEVSRLADSPTDAGLTEAEQAIVAYARKAAGDPVSITPDDVERLRKVGLSDTEIFDVASAVAARCFFTTLGDALGNLPDPVYRDLGELADSLSVGRPVAS